MSLHTHIPLRGITRKLPEARGWYPAGKRSTPAVILYEGDIFARASLTNDEVEVIRALLVAESESVAPSGRKKFGHGDLKRELVDIIRHEVPLEEGKRVPPRQLRRIISILRKRGWDVKPESVRKKLIDMGYRAAT